MPACQAPPTSPPTWVLVLQLEPVHAQHPVASPHKGPGAGAADAVRPCCACAGAARQGVVAAGCGGGGGTGGGGSCAGGGTHL